MPLSGTEKAVLYIMFEIIWSFKWLSAGSQACRDKNKREERRGEREGERRDSK